MAEDNFVGRSGTENFDKYEIVATDPFDFAQDKLNELKWIY